MSAWRVMGERVKPFTSQSKVRQILELHAAP